MEVGRWERVKELFEAALERAEPERSPFLDQACPNDPGLRHEVESLLSGDKNAGDFLQEPVAHISPAALADDHPHPTFSPGEIVSGRFEILRFMGRGGMGEVYEARDLERKVRVALKTIRPEIASDPKTLARFNKEIDLALRVTHHNVCRVYDLERHRPPAGSGKPEVVFLTMELLEGGTLADRLRRQGRMSCEEALPLIRQMADGLAAAHRVGVIHRDFKPGNVMLVPEHASAPVDSDRTTQSPKQASTEPGRARPAPQCAVRAVITDFGLAKASEAAASIDDGSSSITAARHLIGTPAYMAPEQLEGREVTPATDVYAFGLVLYEMLTGHRPFPGNPYNRLREQPPSLRTYVPDLDELWEAIIWRCLQVDPGKRFASTQDIISSVEKPESPVVLSVWGQGELPARGTKVVLPKKRLLGLAALVLTLSLALLAWYLRVNGWMGNRAVPAGSSLLLTDIENETKDPELDGVTELLRNDLAQSAYFNLLSDGQIRETLERMVRPPDQKMDYVTARGIAWRNAAPLAVFGKISSFAQEYTLALRVERVGPDPNYDEAHWTKTWPASKRAEIFDAVRDASRWVRERAGEAAKDIAEADRPPEDITTNSWEALRLFTVALEKRRADRHEEAISLLKEAIREDPQFGAALMVLGDAYDSLGQYKESYNAYQRALGTFGARRLTKKEELRIRGLAAWEVEDYSGSESAFSTYTALYPDDEVGWFYRAHPLMMLGNPEQAIAVLHEAERLRPSASRVYGHLAKDNMIIGKFDQVERNIARLRALGKNDDADLYQGQLFFLTGQYQTAETLLLQLQQSKDPEVRSIGYSVLACLLAELGRYNEAITTLQRGIDEDSSAGNVGGRADRLLGLASLYARSGDKSACREACLEALRLDDSFPHALSAGTILARSGFLVDAQNALAAVSSQKYFPISEIVRHRLEGEIALSAGQNQRALAEFEKADVIEPPAVARDYLARALVASDKPVAALSLYSRVLGSPGQIWQEPQDYEPGFLAGMLFQYGKLAARLGKADASDTLMRYLKMREHSDHGLLEVEDARALLRRTRASAQEPSMQ